MNKFDQLAGIGQSIWLDYIRRAFITSGELDALVHQGLRGVTSNPSILENAIVGSSDYEASLHKLAEAGRTIVEIYEALAIEDIRRAADVLLPVYKQTGGDDGYVSLEVSPTLANDTPGTITEARRLYAELGRPNVMIKVPATMEGIPAVEALIGEGININVTLMFSLEQYEAVAEAYISGLEKLVTHGGDPSKVASVASFFISRVDSQVNQQLEALGERDLQGKIAIANAKMAYARFETKFSGPRWEALTSQGARPQRVLWASTSTKDPSYPDTMYVDELIGPQTVNTLPPGTLQAFLDHGNVGNTLPVGVDDAQKQLSQLAALGINLQEITDQLLVDGVKSFAKSFESLMQSIADKREMILAGWKHQEAVLGSYQGIVEKALDDLENQHVVSRIWSMDHSVWSTDPEEIVNRLGWLHIAERMIEQVDRLDQLREAARGDGYTHALLLGMGGSSLAPEVFRKTFGVASGALDLAVLDSTDPGAVLSFDQALDLSRTIFVVATKSGGTVETLSFFKYFYNRVIEEVGLENAGAHFVAITDPGSKLADIAEQYGFRATFLNDPNIGGRYAALSYFGLVPAALLGLDVRQLLDRAMAMASGCESCVGARENPAGWLGTILGELAKVGRDKLTLVTSPEIQSFGDWVEQLIAESTGKSGEGILPVVGEHLGDPEVYADDRLFVHLRLPDDERLDEALNSLEIAGHPILRLHLHDLYDLGGQFFLWELATAVAGFHLKIHPFNQPDVEAAKVLARRMVTAYHEKGQLPSSEAQIEENGIKVYSEMTTTSLKDAFVSFLNQADLSDGSAGAKRSYVAIQAYLQPTEETANKLQALRVSLRDRYRLATTLGFGPRFLHSTGQLHKGDSGNGLFIQFTADDAQDAAIPDQAGEERSLMSFGVLKAAQALGDRQALLDAKRRLIRFHLGKDIHQGIDLLLRSLE